MLAYAIISAIAALYSAYAQSESQQAAAKQSEYDAEFEAQQAQNAAEQERLNRDQERTQAARMAEEDKRRRLSILTRAGGGIGVSAVQELSRQASIDEINIQNADLASLQKRRAMGLSATNALISGRARSSSYKAASRASIAGGISRAAGAGASYYGNKK